MSTITLLRAKEYIRVDHSYENHLIQALLDGAETYVRSLCVDYLTEGGEWDDLPNDLQLAVLLLVSHFYDNRGAVADRAGHEIPFSVSALIANYRDYDADE